MARFYEWCLENDTIDLKEYKGVKKITTPNEWSNLEDLYHFLKGSKRSSGKGDTM